MLEILDPLRLNVLSLPTVLRKSHAEELASHAAKRPDAIAYDVLADYSRVTKFNISPDDIVRFAMKRRAGLPESSTRPLKSAIVGIRPVVWQVLETWLAFFDETNRVVESRTFDTVEAALDWLERSEALDTVNASLAGLSARQ
ncbi:MAG: hypothetical protein RIA71_03975 [Oceanicaulis sp.]